MYVTLGSPKPSGGPPIVVKHITHFAQSHTKRGHSLLVIKAKKNAYKYIKQNMLAQNGVSVARFALLRINRRHGHMRRRGVCRYKTYKDFILEACLEACHIGSLFELFSQSQA